VVAGFRCTDWPALRKRLAVELDALGRPGLGSEAELGETPRREIPWKPRLWIVKTVFGRTTPLWWSSAGKRPVCKSFDVDDGGLPPDKSCPARRARAQARTPEREMVSRPITPVTVSWLEPPLSRNKA